MPILTPNNGLYITEGMDYLYPKVAGGTILQQSVESGEELNEQLIVDRTYNGLIKTRSWYPNLGVNKSFNKIFTIIHPVVNTDQKDWIIQFYKVNRLIPFKITWKADNRIYDVLFLEPPKITMLGGQWWKVGIKLAQINNRTLVTRIEIYDEVGYGESAVNLIGNISYGNFGTESGIYTDEAVFLAAHVGLALETISGFAPEGETWMGVPTLTAGVSISVEGFPIWTLVADDTEVSYGEYLECNVFVASLNSAFPSRDKLVLTFNPGVACIGFRTAVDSFAPTIDFYNNDTLLYHIPNEVHDPYYYSYIGYAT
jgi:hypothetical protein